MSNRSASESRAIDESTREDQEQRKPRRRAAGFRGLRASWGGQDADFYFRWAEAAIGFKAQGIEPQAETIGRLTSPFWDDRAALMDRLKRMPAAAKAKYLANMAEPAPTTGPRPSKGRQPKAGLNPDRMSDRNLDAVRRFRRVHAGMNALKIAGPQHFAALHQVFLPHRTDPEIEGYFSLELSALAIRIDRTRKAYGKAVERAEEPISLETWLLGLIRRNEDVLRLIRADCEKLSLEAIAALEAVTEPPKDVREAREARGEDAPRRGPDKGPRAPRSRAAADSFLLSIGDE